MSFAPPLASSDIYAQRKKEPATIFDRNWPRPILRVEIKNQYFFSEKKSTEIVKL